MTIDRQRSRVEDVRQFVQQTGVSLPVVALILSTITLSLVAAGPGVVVGDVAITRWMQRAPDTGIGTMLHAMNTIGETPVMLAIGALLAVIAWRRQRLDALMLIAAATLLRVANPILKALVASPRPTADRVGVEEVATGWGFPSGHVMGMTLLVGTVAALLWHRHPNRAVRLTLLMTAGAILLASGAGRIYVGAHWPTDVLGGYLYGSLGVSALVRIWQWHTTGALAPRLLERLSLSDAQLNVRARRVGGGFSMDAMVLRRWRFGAITLGGVVALMLVVAVNAAQTSPTTGDFTARIIAGSCADTSATTAYDLKPLSLTASDDDDDDDDDDAPSGNPIGAADAIPVATSGNDVNVSLDTLTAQPHAIVVTAGAAGAEVIACGAIGGQLRGDDNLIVGLTPVNGSTAAGVAYLDGDHNDDDDDDDDDDNQTDITVYLVSWS